MRSLDCTDIKALLSGLVDGELDETTRYDAERHLATCRPCRELIDEAESLDELVQANVASLVDPRGLPPGFEGAVLGRTLYEQTAPSYLRQWTTWTGWVAAAAAIALAVTLWLQDGGGSAPTPTLPGPGPSTAETIPAVYAPGISLRSWTLDEVLDADTAAGLPSITRDDADALYFASVILAMLTGPEPDVARAREAVEYDSLLPKLSDLRHRLGPEDRTTVLTAEMLLAGLITGPLDADRLGEVQAIIAELELRSSLEAMSDRWDETNAL